MPPNSRISRTAAINEIGNDGRFLYNPGVIAQLRGSLLQKSANRVVVDVQGVGYEVTIPFSTYYELGEPGSPVQLLIFTYVREDTLSLFGFRTSPEKQLFTQLLQISGIGPRLAVTILSGLPLDELLEAIAVQDVRRICSIPGVGKKTAERIALEMKDRIDQILPDFSERSAASPQSQVGKDVVSALVNLGYAGARAEPVVDKLVKSGGPEQFDLLLKRALKEISG